MAVTPLPPSIFLPLSLFFSLRMARREKAWIACENAKQHYNIKSKFLDTATNENGERRTRSVSHEQRRRAHTMHTARCSFQLHAAVFCKTFPSFAPSPCSRYSTKSRRDVLENWPLYSQRLMGGVGWGLALEFQNLSLQEHKLKGQ